VTAYLPLRDGVARGPTQTQVTHVDPVVRPKPAPSPQEQTMALQSLLFTADQYVVHHLRSVLRDLGIGTEVCSQAEQAGECLRSRHFDLAILDCDAAGVDDVIGQLRTAPSSRGAPMFLIGPADRSAQTSLGEQASQVLSRPLSLEQTWRTLRSARQQMEFTRFRYFRVWVEADALLLCSEARRVHARARNVGATGVGLQVPVPLGIGEMLGLRLELPGCAHAIESQAEVVWSNAKGDAGLRFTLLADDCRSALEAWIAKRLEDREFAFVFNGARAMLRPVLIPAIEPTS